MQWTDRIRQVKIILVVAAILIAIASLVVSISSLEISLARSAIKWRCGRLPCAP